MPAPFVVTTGLAAFLACGGSYKTFNCDGSTIQVPKSCSADTESFVRTRAATITQKIEALDGAIDSETQVQLAGQIALLNGQLDALTQQYQVTLVSLCQNQAMDPCNAELRQRVAEARERYADEFLAARNGVDTALAAVQSGDPAAAQAAVVEAAVALGADPPAPLEPAEAPESPEEGAAEEPSEAATEGTEADEVGAVKAPSPIDIDGGIKVPSGAGK